LLTGIPLNSEEQFWTEFSRLLQIFNPKYRIEEFSTRCGLFELLLTSPTFKKKTVLCIDEFDVIYEADSKIKDSILSAFRLLQHAEDSMLQGTNCFNFQNNFVQV
jgi:hypothetical protein